MSILNGEDNGYVLYNVSRRRGRRQGVVRIRKITYDTRYGYADEVVMWGGTGSVT